MAVRATTLLSILLVLVAVNVHDRAVLGQVEDTSGETAVAGDADTEAIDEQELGPDNETSDELEQRNPALAVAVRVIAAGVKWAAKHCLKAAALNCKKHWKHPKNLVHCAKGYLRRQKARCVTG